MPTAPVPSWWSPIRRPLSPAWFANGPGADIQFQTSTTTLLANWTAFSDAESGILRYQMGHRHDPRRRADPTLRPAGEHRSERGLQSGLSLAGGTRYYVTVRAVNGAGMITSASSDGVTVRHHRASRRDGLRRSGRGHRLAELDLHERRQLDGLHRR